jgi:hypothetical protein
MIYIFGLSVHLIYAQPPDMPVQASSSVQKNTPSTKTTKIPAAAISSTDIKALIELYNDLVRFQKVFPGKPYSARGIGDMYTALKDSLKNAQKTGLNDVYQNILLDTEPVIFEKIFSPENIQMLAYQQNKFGNGKPFTFNGTFGFSNRSEEPTLIEYTQPNGKKIVITRYSYFYSMLNNIDAAIEKGMRIFYAPFNDPNLTFDERPLQRCRENFAILQNNVTQALNNASTLTATQIGQMAQDYTQKGNMAFLNLINSISGVFYTYKGFK